MRESAIEKAICAHAKSLGVTVQKQNGPGERGKADRLFMKAGTAAFLEIKRSGGKPTELQLKYLRERNADGFPASWCDNIAEGVKFLNDVFR